MPSRRMAAGVFGLQVLSLLAQQTSSFVPSSSRILTRCRPNATMKHSRPRICYMSNRQEDPAVVEEEVRVKILGDRRRQVRSALKAAERLRNFRLSNGFVPEIDEETGKPVQSDGKFAVSLTAFIVAGGAVALRIGGRAALISTLGLDFVTDNPDLKQNLDQILMYSDNMDPIAKVGAFIAAWTAVKVFCVDFAGVALALSSGILFGGVLQGAVASAGAATIGSCVAFSLAKLDTPVRKKALELLDEYPSLRGIEKVVARDGLKAILTLRLAPVLPIPIGMYNYIYGVTKVPVSQFAGGIFLGSMKPYLLDSYLGFFGKSIVDGSLSLETSWQDIILLVVLGVSVLIGVLASQLAAETWESVLEEVEAEKAQKEGDPKKEEEDDGTTGRIAGFEMPQWVVGFQLSLQQASTRMNEMILDEYDAKVWNYTKEEEVPPADVDPARAPSSPEVFGANKGLDYVAGLCDGLVTSPVLFSAILKYGDPLYKEEEDEQITKRVRADPSIWLPQDVSSPDSTSYSTMTTTSAPVGEKEETSEKALLTRLDGLESRTRRRLDLVGERLEDL